MTGQDKRVFLTYWKRLEFKDSDWHIFSLAEGRRNQMNWIFKKGTLNKQDSISKGNYFEYLFSKGFVLKLMFTFICRMKIDSRPIRFNLFSNPNLTKQEKSSLFRLNKKALCQRPINKIAKNQTRLKWLLSKFNCW